MPDVVRFLFEVIVPKVLYPVMIVGVVGLVLFMSVRIVLDGYRDGTTPWHEVVRRAVGALFPFVVLIFLNESLPGNELLRWLKALFAYIGPWTQFFLGVAAGLLAMALTEVVLSLNNPVGEAVAALYFSVLGAMLLLVLMQAGVAGIHLFLFGLVIAISLYIIFRGIPKS